ncbi:MAG: YcxB family protein [Chitinophagaceae bacterium]|nr:YcxB family protein [Chitinophagaceae bacterium]
MLTISYTITEKEFLDYFYYICWLRPEKKKRRLLYYTVVPLASFGFMYGMLSILEKGKVGIASMIFAAVFALALLLLVPYEMKRSSRLNAQKILAKSGPDTILTLYEITIAEQGIAGKTKVKEIRFSWEAFTNKVMVNNCYYLYLNINQALVIPLRAFTTEKEKKEFEALLEQYISPNTLSSFQK